MVVNERDCQQIHIPNTVFPNIFRMMAIHVGLFVNRWPVWPILGVTEKPANMKAVSLNQSKEIHSQLRGQRLRLQTDPHKTILNKCSDSRI